MKKIENIDLNSHKNKRMTIVTYKLLEVKIHKYIKKKEIRNFDIDYQILQIYWKVKTIMVLGAVKYVLKTLLKWLWFCSFSFHRYCSPNWERHFPPWESVLFVFTGHFFEIVLNDGRNRFKFPKIWLWVFLLVGVSIPLFYTFAAMSFRKSIIKVTSSFQLFTTLP